MNRRWWVLAALLGALSPLWVLAQGAPGGETTPLRDMSSFALWSLILGVAASLLTAVLTKTHWSGEVKMAVFAVFSIGAGFGNAAFNGDVDWHDVSRSVLVILASGWFFWMANQSGLRALSARTD